MDKFGGRDLRKHCLRTQKNYENIQENRIEIIDKPAVGATFSP